jgi:hypothetical protein
MTLAVVHEAFSGGPWQVFLDAVRALCLAVGLVSSSVALSLLALPYLRRNANWAASALAMVFAAVSTAYGEWDHLGHPAANGRIWFNVGFAACFAAWCYYSLRLVRSERGVATNFRGPVPVLRWPFRRR